MQFDIHIASENAVIVYFHAGDLLQNNQWVQALVAIIDQDSPAWLLDLTPAYHSVLIMFDALIVDHLYIKDYLKKQLKIAAPILPDEKIASRLELPVWYAPEINHDLVRIAELANLTVEEVIAIHSATEYCVFCLGFAPGFAFLGQVDERIATPRLPTPRQKVPAGAVAIADRQTAVYPSPSPGGWNILGLCPLPLFEPDSDPITPFNVGDTVKFVGIDQQKYFELGGKI